MSACFALIYSSCSLLHNDDYHSLQTLSRQLCFEGCRSSQSSVRTVYFLEGRKAESCIERLTFYWSQPGLRHKLEGLKQEHMEKLWTEGLWICRWLLFGKPDSSEALLKPADPRRRGEHPQSRIWHRCCQKCPATSRSLACYSALQELFPQSLNSITFLHHWLTLNSLFCKDTETPNQWVCNSLYYNSFSQ